MRGDTSREVGKDCFSFNGLLWAWGWDCPRLGGPAGTMGDTVECLHGHFPGCVISGSRCTGPGEDGSAVGWG